MTLLEKLSRALEQIDSSSGALGTAVNRAIDTLVPIIAKVVGLWNWWRIAYQVRDGHPSG